MKPSAMLLGFVLGSAAAITFALFGVTVVFMFLKPQYPRIDRELPALGLSLGLFAVLTCAAGASFYAQLHATPWRRPAIALLLLGIAAVGWYYWPR
jgi:uncharacterized transporter YbjL